jgi:AraC family transcriptional regulator
MNASTIRSTNPIITLSLELEKRATIETAILAVPGGFLRIYRQKDRMKVKYRKSNQRRIGEGSLVPKDSPRDPISPGAKRFYVRVGARMVSPFPGSPVLDCEHSPWTGLVVEKHHHQGCEVPVHDHETLGLHLQTEGEIDMEWFCSGRSGRQRSTPGSMLLHPAGTRDRAIWHGSTKRVIVSIEPTMLKDAAEQMGINGFCDFDIHWSLRDEQLSLLLTEMNREMKSGWLMGSLYGDLLGMSLSVALIKKYGETASYIPRLKGGLSRAHIKEVIAYIKENIDKDIRLDDLATLSGLSRFHFARSFRESLGETPYQFILKKRIQSAKKLLVRPEWNVRQIASAIGFADVSQFSKMFRKSTGVTPTTWRRQA